MVLLFDQSNEELFNHLRDKTWQRWDCFSNGNQCRAKFTSKALDYLCRGEGKSSGEEKSAEEHHS